MMCRNSLYQHEITDRQRFLARPLPSVRPPQPLSESRMLWSFGQTGNLSGGAPREAMRHLRIMGVGVVDGSELSLLLFLSPPLPPNVMQESEEGGFFHRSCRAAAGLGEGGAASQALRRRRRGRRGSMQR